MSQSPVVEEGSVKNVMNPAPRPRCRVDTDNVIANFNWR